jgi:pyrroloquinoline quinone biosynthesis protein B
MKIRYCLMGLMTILLATCLQAQVSKSDAYKDPYIVVLGTLQDGGSPHLGCEKDCCKTIDPNKKVVSLGLIDPASGKRFLFEASPDINSQLKMLNQSLGDKKENAPDGIFLTHAHIGHYAGLMFLGREAMNSKDVPVYAMPKMKIFLENNGPWSQLVSLNNIRIHPLSEGKWEDLGPRLKVKPILVPHRDEFSETVGYIIEGPNKKLLFIPDIDKWEKWRTDIVSLIKEVDHALIDGTFFSATEVGNRNIAEIPHPLVQESMKLFDALPTKEKEKIMFIHFNHTNPMLNEDSEEVKLVKSNGFRIATMHLQITL